MSVARCLTIAGSDSGGGAGIQADLKAFAAAGCYGMSAIVALTAQNTVGVTSVQEVAAEFVEAQLEAVFSDIGVDAAKTGMLFSREIVETVAAFLAEHPVPLVVDPVMISAAGAQLLQDDAVEALVMLLFPLATVITPNLHEAQALAEVDTEDRGVLAEQLHALGAARGARHRRSRRARSRSPLHVRQARGDPGRPSRRGCDTRCRVYALGDTGRAARTGQVARGSGARRCGGGGRCRGSRARRSR